MTFFISTMLKSKTILISPDSPVHGADAGIEPGTSAFLKALLYQLSYIGLRKLFKERTPEIHAV